MLAEMDCNSHPTSHLIAGPEFDLEWVIAELEENLLTLDHNVRGKEGKGGGAASFTTTTGTAMEVL